MDARADTRDLNNISIQAVGRLLGINLPLKGMTRCPFPDHNDSNPSFEVRHHGRRWVCYGCDRRGGSIDLVKEYQQIPFVEAKRWLADQTGLAQTGSRRRLRQSTTVEIPSSPSTQDERQGAAEEPPDYDVYEYLLSNAPLRESGRSYLTNRGLSGDTVTRFRVHQMPSAPVLKKLVSEFGFERIKKSGLLTKQSDTLDYRPIIPPNSILFPFIEDGKVAYLQGRCIDGWRNARWRNLNNRRQRIYNSDILQEKNIKRIAVCEGVIDVLSATQMKCEAVGLIGVSARLTDVHISRLRGKQVELFFDWDEAGEKRARTMRDELRRFGVFATRRTAPKAHAKDLNEILQLGWSSI